jgi:hypothetical protein
VANNKGSGPGGANDAGPFVGKRTVHWNVNIFIDPNYPMSNTASNGGLYVYQPRQYVMGAMVGIRGQAVNSSEGWAMPAGDKGVIVADNNKVPTVVNLYEAQKNLRCNATFITDEDKSNRLEFDVYPNPARNSITVKVSSVKREEVMIKILSMQGSKIIEEKREISPGENTFIFNPVDINPGLYIILLDNPSGEISTKKIVIN